MAKLRRQPDTFKFNKQVFGRCGVAYGGAGISVIVLPTWPRLRQSCGDPVTWVTGCPLPYWHEHGGCADDVLSRPESVAFSGAGRYEIWADYPSEPL
jgi:hypothetical protein